MMKTYLLFLSIAALAKPSTNAPTAKFVDQPNSLIQNSRQLTFVGPRSGEGYFSADGTKMVFQGERDEGNPFYQMFILDLKTGKTNRISTGQGKTTCGWIHPEGKKVMWSSTHLDKDIPEKVKKEFEERKNPVKSRYSWSYDEHFDIFESDLQGKKVKRLTREKGYDAEGSYSPDGKWIAFASNREGYSSKLSDEDRKLFERDPSYMMDIYIMKADGTGVKRLTDSKGYDGGPFFSADGKKITWRRFNPEGSKAEIFTMNVDGSDQKQVTRLGSMSWAPYYHPSGDYIIFASSVLGYANFELFIVDAEGTKDPVRVSFDDGFDGLAAYSPDGHRLTWTHRNEKGESQIMIADWDDAQARRLLGLPAATLQPQSLTKDIRESDIRQLVGWLASEELKGRKAGSPEEENMAKKLADLFKSWGLVGASPQGGFLHRFDFTSSVTLGKANQAELKGKFTRALKIGTEAEPYSLSASIELHETPLTFVGFGIKAPATEKEPAYDSYKGLDVQGKWVVMLRDLPADVTPERRHQLNVYARLQHKVTVAREAGAKGIFVIEGLTDLKPMANRALRFEGHMAASSLPAWRLGGAWINDLMKVSGQDFKQVTKKLDAGEIVQFEFPSTYAKAQSELVSEKSTGINVLAKWPSGRKNAKAVLIGAHGDHLGQGAMSGSSLAKPDEANGIHYGADDNASGVAALLEIAHKVSSDRQKRAQDLVFGIWSAEEIGLIGSSSFVKDWEAKNKKKLKSTFTAALNMDMIGRLKGAIQVQGVGSGDHWASLSEEITLRTGLPMTLTNDPYVPTDAMSFYLAGLPSISFFTGAHGEYHTPRDRAELLNNEGIRRVTEVVYEFSKTLAAADLPLVKYKEVPGSASSRMEGRSFRIYLGTIPDYSQEGVRGVLISGSSKGSPAEKAGLREKDVIVEFNGTKIENIYDYVYTLQTVKPDAETSIKAMRAGKLMEFNITPRLKE
ncbi:MAG: M20/M25/M40 family metallo-hydrolase [Bdellovibrionaceae bacterium]|nr:M20/M25/M40 family metallo-hydrolase [Pseudobdellovibrionaceae bacterium]